MAGKRNKQQKMTTSMTWESGVYRRTRSSAGSTRPVKEMERACGFVPFWVLELACVEDFFVYQHAPQALWRNIHRYVADLAMDKMNNMKNTKGRRMIVPWIPGSNVGFHVFYSPNDQEEPTVPVPWTLREIGDGLVEPLTRIQDAMMRAVERRLGNVRVRWCGAKSSGCLPVLQNTTPVVPVEIDLLLKKACVAVGVILETGETLCENDVHLRPDLKYKTDNRLLRVDDDARLVQERARVAKKYAEITLLPYITTDARRQCRKDGFYGYKTQGLDEYLVEKCDERIFHRGLHRYTIPWLGALQSSSEAAWGVDADRLGDILRSSGVDPTLPQRWLFIDFETNIVRNRDSQEYEQRIYMCGCYRVDWDGGGWMTPTPTPTSTRMEILVSTDLESIEAEARLMEAAAAEFRAATHVFYYAAERGFWKSACKRQGLSLHDPLVGVLDHAIDLLVVLQQSRLFLRGAPNQKLKTIGAALLECGLLDLQFPQDAGVVNGEDSMSVSKIFYSSGGTQAESNHVSRIHLPGPFSYPASPTVDMSSPVAFTHFPRKAREALHSLVVYNQYDCIILAEILRVLQTMSA